MLDLHDMQLTVPDKHKLKMMCIQKNNLVKYKDALALINVNRDLREDGSPARFSEGFWTLQLPQRKSKQGG